MNKLLKFARIAKIWSTIDKNVNEPGLAIKT